MRIQEIEIDNYRCYDSESVSFDDGLVLIYGDNGAGKSSLLASIFSGLYMSDSTKYIKGNVNLNSLIRSGKDEARIRVAFEVGNKDYEIVWEVSVRDSRASTKKCTIRGSDIDGTIEGFREVREKVGDIIGMDAQSFVNSVYVQQDQITRFVDTDLGERKKILDGLLGLSKIDTYIDRMDKVRMEYGAQKRKIDGIIEEKEREKQNIPPEDKIKSNIESLNGEIETKKTKVEKLDNIIQKTKEQKQNIQSEIDEHKSRKNKINDLEQKIEDTKEKRENIEEKIESIRIDIDSKEDEIDNLESSYASVSKEDVVEKISQKEKQVEVVEERVQRLENLIDKKQSEIADINRSIKTQKQSLKSLRSRKENLKQNISEANKDLKGLKESLEDKKAEISKLKEKISNLSNILNIDTQSIDTIKNQIIPKKRESISEDTQKIHRRIGRLKQRKEIHNHIVENGICSICESKVTEVSDSESTVQELDEYIRKSKESTESKSQNLDLLNTLDEEINNLSQLQSEVSNIQGKISRKKSLIEEKKSRLNSVSEEMKNTEQEISSLEGDISTVQEDIDEMTDELEEEQNRLSELVSKKEELENIREKIDRIEHLKSLVEEKKEQIQSYREMRDSKQDTFLNLKQKVRDVRESLNDIGTKRKELADKSEKLEKARTKKSDLSETIDDLRVKKTQKQQELDRVRQIKKRFQQLTDRKQQANEKEEESKQIISTYKKFKRDLRQENIGLLNKYANEIFSSVYSNQVYQSLNISEEYKIRLITGDGLEVSPQDLSGGEKTIISLSIRAGIYKLLVDQRGKIDNLPPIILDEPTTYLDDKHITNLQNVIDKIRSWDVPQVFVVSHRENMIENATSSYEVTKNPTTESSEITKTR